MINFQKIFYSYTMPSKHLLNSAFCVGTNVVYRKSALDEIGGIPLVNHSEDVFTSLKLTEHGWIVSYLNKELAYGLSADNVISFFNQQFRWATGGLTMLFSHNTLFNKKINFDQKIEYFMSNIFYLIGISTFIYLISPVIAILFNIKPINDIYFFEWLRIYAMFFLFNFVFYALTVNKYRIQAMALGMFCFIPYLSALFSILSFQKFIWKPTNFISGGIVARLVAPLVSYLFIVGVIFYLFLTKILTFNITFAWYIFWMIINSLLIIYFIFSAYKSIFFIKNK